MPITRHRYAHTEARLPSARIPQFVVCDLEAELPTVDVGEGDIAYAKDSDKLLKRTASSWFEIAGSAPGLHAATHVENGTDELLAELLGTAEMTTSKILKPDGAGGVAWGAAASVSGKQVWRFAVSDPAPGNSLYPLLISPYAGTVTKVQAIRVGSGSVSLDVEVAGAEIVGTDIVVGTTWTASAALTAAVAIGNTIAISLKSVVSPVGYLAVQVEFEGS